MSNLWWLQPEWKQATCGGCGVNIWDAGGDPDHGVCLSCWEQQWQQAEMEREEYEHEREEWERQQMEEHFTQYPHG